MGDFDYSGRHSGAVKPYSSYAHQSVTISGAQSGYSLYNHTPLFTRVSSPSELLIRNGAAAISVKFNADSNDSIPISAGSDFGVQGLIVTDVLVTTSGNTSFDIFTMGWK